MASKRYTQESLADAISKSTTWSDVCRLVGVTPSTGGQTYLTTLAKKWNLDSSHFLGRMKFKGKVLSPKRPIELYLTNQFSITSHQLRLRLIKEGFKKQECEKCGLTEWLGKPISLELDHINSNHFDNALQNLQILCPNCHAQKTNGRVA